MLGEKEGGRRRGRNRKRSDNYLAESLAARSPLAHIAEFAVALLSDNVDEDRSRKFGYRFAFDENLSCCG